MHRGGREPHGRRGSRVRINALAEGRVAAQGGNRVKNVVGIIQETLQEGAGDRAPQQAAALSFYSLLALAPLLLIAIAIAGLVYGPGAARDTLITQVHDKAGAQVADAAGTILTNAHRPGAGIAAFIIGSILLLLGAFGAFSMMRTALNAMWRVQEPPVKGFLSKIRHLLTTSLVNVAFVLGFGIGLLALLVASAAWTWVAGKIGGSLPAADVTLRAADFVVTLGLLTLLFAALFRVAASARPDWADLWLGAFVTALLFNVGRLAIGLYLGRSTTTASFGAAGSVVALLLWMYYSAMIMFFGAEFIQVHTRRHGRRLQPKQRAVLLREETDRRSAA